MYVRYRERTGNASSGSPSLRCGWAMPFAGASRSEFQSARSGRPSSAGHSGNACLSDFRHSGLRRSANASVFVLLGAVLLFALPGAIHAQTPVSTFSVSTSSIAESAGTHEIVVNLSPVPSRNIEVTYTISGGSADHGTDYSISGVNRFGVGLIIVGTSGSANIPVVITDDSDVEGSETVILTLQRGPRNNVGATLNKHTLTITDDDMPGTPEANFALSKSSASESRAMRNVAVNLSPAPTGNVTVNYTLSGEAVRGTDYTISGVTGNSGTITVGTSGTADIPVAIIDDSMDEAPTEPIILTLASGTGYDVGTDNPKHTLSIVDNDLPDVTFAASTSSAAESAGTHNIAVNLSNPELGAITVNYTLSGTAVRGTDYTISGVTSASGTVLVNGGGIRSSVNIPVVITDDSAAEGNETVILTLGSGTGYDVGSASTHTLTITDNEPPGTPQANFAASTSSAAESAGTRNIAVSLSPVPTGNVTVNYTLSGTAVRGTDYTISGVSSNSGTITVGTSGTANIPVVITDDSAVESSETVILTLDSGTGYDVGATTTTHTLTITNNDTPEANFAASASSAAEDAGTHNIAVNLSPVPLGNVTVNYTLSGDAMLDTDYSISGVSSNSGTITVGTSGTANIPVVITDDSAEEDSETVILTLGSGTGYDVGATTTTHTLTITDNDRVAPPPEVTITGGSAVTEGGDASFTISSNPAPSSSITVSYTVSQSGTFVASGQLGDKTQSVSAASTTFAIPTEDDNLEEAGGSVTVTLTNGTGYTVGAPSAATVNVNDDDAPTPPATPAASFASASGSASEGAGTHNVAVNVNPAPSAAITLNYSVAGTATEGADYSIGNSGTVSVSAGQSSVNIPVAIADDSEVEGSETVILTLGSGTGYDVGSASVYTMTITDNDNDGGGDGGGGNDVSQVTLSISPNPVVEGEETTVTVTLSPFVPSVVTIPLVLTAGTAEVGDYGALASIVIDANEPNGWDEIVTVVDDDLEDETFTVSLGALPAGFAAGAQASVEVTIEDHAGPTSIESFGDEVPKAFALDQNYPNPFNPVTTIGFSLARTQHVRLAVYDLLGHEVRVLLDGVQTAARYRIPFDASDLASGTYLYILRTEEQTAARTMALLK